MPRFVLALAAAVLALSVAGPARAEQQAETRKRIVAAAVELHTTVGPAATTFSMVAEQAGVSESLISQIERNRISPAIDTLLKIIDVLEIDLDFIFRDLKKDRPVNLVRANEKKRAVIEHWEHASFQQRLKELERRLQLQRRRLRVLQAQLA